MNFIYPCLYCDYTQQVGVLQQVDGAVQGTKAHENNFYG